MATTLDSMVNLRNPLGLTSLMGTPVKEKPPVAPSSQAAFPSIERPADPRPGIEKQRDEIGLTSSNIDVQIINNLAQQGRFQGEQAKQKAESEAQSLRELDTSRKALEKSLYESPAYKTIQEKSKELAEKSTFNPDQQNAQTLAAVFSIIGAAGFLLGGNNKNTAKAALAAMNGMAEGYSKGRDQYAKEQRQEFETNQKALRGTLDSLEKAFAYEIEQNKGNIEAATRNAKIAALERDASFINDNIDKYGLVSTLEQLRSNKKRLETVLGALQKKEDAYSAEMQKEWFANESRKATAAAAQERVQYQEQERARREQERREDQQRFQRERDQFRIENRAERGQGKVQPIGMANGQMIMVDGNGNIVAKPVPEGFKGFGRFGEKADPAAKPPPINVQQAVQLRNTLIPELETVLPVLERINRQGDWPKFTGLIGVEPRAAEFAFNKDPEAQKAIRTLSRFRSAEFETAGKALTKVENKILAPLYQSGFRDYNALKGAVEDGLEAMSAQKVAYERQYPQLANQESAVRPAPPKPSGPKEGDEAPSKSGKPMVFKNGAWEYKQ
jgi:chemotaxis protein histidine kinase CheA